MRPRKIIHVDMDCFYAAVEVKHRPELRGKPLGIGGPPDSRAVLCTASYEARRYGVRSAMPSSQAVRLCPSLILLPPRFDLYRQESEAVRRILEDFTSKIEPLSLDEAYLDVSQEDRFEGSATRMAQEIRRRIQDECGLTASAGVAPNKFLAKIASDWRKPDGLFVIRPEDVDAFMPDLPIERLHGVGRVTAAKMHERGLQTCADLQRQPLDRMTKWFGSRGASLLELARGIDVREVESRSERKSLTVEETYNRDLHTLDECLMKLPALYDDWSRRMEGSRAAERIHGPVVKVKYHDFKDATHQKTSTTWPRPEDFRELLTHLWNKRPAPVRLLGLGVRLQSAMERETGQLHFELE